MPQPTVAAGLPAALLKYAVLRGADRDDLLLMAGLSEPVLADPDNRVPLSQYLSLFAASVVASGDPAFALHFGESTLMRDISVVGIVTEAAGSAQSTVDLLNKYASLTMDEGDRRPAERVGLVTEDGETWLKFYSPLFVEHRDLAESSFARCVCGARALSAERNGGSPKAFLKAIHFTHNRPSYHAAHERLFAVPVVFGSDKNAWLLDERIVAAMRSRPEAYTAHAVRKHADALLERVKTVRTVRGQVEHIVRSELATGVSMTRVSSSLGVSRQTLLRKLRAESTSFEAVVDELRHKVAIENLGTRRLSVKQTAKAAGFADVSAFSRAFKRWTGQRPRAWLGARSELSTNDTTLEP